MTRTHAFLIAVAVAIAVVAGSFAALRTTQLGAAAAPRVDAAQIARQNRALDRAEVALRKQLAARPPALPPAPLALPPAPAGAPQRVIYVRAKPLVRVVPRHGDDNEHETGREADRGDDGARFDD
jgi:hypothetical protein